MTQAFCHLVLHYSVARLSWKTIKSLRRSRSVMRRKNYESDGNNEDVSTIEYEILQGWTILAFHSLYVSLGIEYFVRFFIPFYFHLKMIVLLVTFVVPSWGGRKNGSSEFGLSPVISYWFDYLIVPSVNKVHEFMDNDPKGFAKQQIANVALLVIDYLIAPGICTSDEDKQRARERISDGIGEGDKHKTPPANAFPQPIANLKVPEEFSNENRQGGPPQDRGNDDRRPPRKDGEDRPPRKEGKGGPPGMGGSIVGGSSAGMSIHKAEGLVPINDKCESTIPGLYAAGDALGSYMAGGIYTQIGSSLSGSAVQGAIAGETAAKYSKNIKAHRISASKLNEIEEDILAPLKREAGYSPAWVTQTLQSIMIPNFILYIKKENLMKAALAYIEELKEHHVPHLRASNLHELRLAHETKNMVISAEMKLRASLMRKESRCSHYRLDYPELDNENWQAWINIFKGEDGSMQLEKQPFNTWPIVQEKTINSI